MVIPDFHFAVEQFREFLALNEVRSPIAWVFRDDLCPRTSGHLLVRYPPPPENARLAEKAFSEGQREGLVEITAVASSDLFTAATVWFPRTPLDEVQGWNNGLKLRIVQPLPVADAITFGFTWRMVRWSSVYRRYQEQHLFVGTRAWAAV